MNSSTYEVKHSTYIIAILGPGTYRHPILVDLDIDKSRFTEPFFEMGSRFGRITGFFEGVDKFDIIPLQGGSVERTILGFRLCIPVLKLDPTSGFSAASIIKKTSQLLALPKSLA